MCLSHCSQFTAGFVGAVYVAGRHLRECSVDFLIQGSAFFRSPALFGFQRFKRAAEHLFSILKGARGQTLPHQNFEVGGNVELHVILLLLFQRKGSRGVCHEIKIALLALSLDEEQGLHLNRSGRLVVSITFPDPV